MEKSFKTLVNIICYLAMIIGCLISMFLIVVLGIGFVVLIVTQDFQSAGCAIKHDATITIAMIISIIGTIMFLIVDN